VPTAAPAGSGPLASLAGLIRLAHPFPSLLTGTATTAITTLAGAEPGTALRLGLAMLGIQVSIGALNDLVDAPEDARQKPGKPIPRGLVGRGAATAVVVVAGVTGIALSAVSGFATAFVGLAGAGLGYAYDLRLSRTALSWLPLSLALPLLPIHAWLGATGTIPGGLFALVPVGVLGGGGLALANGLVDLERDGRSGRGAAAVALGRRRTWLAQTAALGVAGLLAVFLAPAVPAAASGPELATLRALRFAGVALGVALIAIGSACLAANRPGVRERGGELEAVGVAGIGLGWLAGIAAAALGTSG
jgi:4-hydroxybenzoate polyprenyltransferase